MIQSNGNFESPIFVTGIPRSGLSMVAGVVGLCGAWIGQTVPGSEIDPAGFFEHHRIREEIVKKLLEEVGADPYGIHDLPKLEDIRPFRRFKFAIRRILESEGYRFDRRWMFKECKLSLTWPVFVEAFPDASWLIVNNDPEAVVKLCLNSSFMRKNSVDPDFWATFVSAYQERLTELKTTAKQVFELDARKINAGQLGELQSAIQQTGLNFSEANVALFATSEFWDIG